MIDKILTYAMYASSEEKRVSEDESFPSIYLLKRHGGASVFFSEDIYIVNRLMDAKEKSG